MSSDRANSAVFPSVTGRRSSVVSAYSTYSLPTRNQARKLKGSDESLKSLEALALLQKIKTNNEKQKSLSTSNLLKKRLSCNADELKAVQSSWDNSRGMVKQKLKSTHEETDKSKSASDILKKYKTLDVSKESKGRRLSLSAASTASLRNQTVTQRSQSSEQINELARSTSTNDLSIPVLPSMNDPSKGNRLSTSAEAVTTQKQTPSNIDIKLPKRVSELSAKSKAANDILKKYQTNASPSENTETNEKVEVKSIDNLRRNNAGHLRKMADQVRSTLPLITQTRRISDCDLPTKSQNDADLTDASRRRKSVPVISIVDHSESSERGKASKRTSPRSRSGSSLGVPSGKDRPLSSISSCGEDDVDETNSMRNYRYGKVKGSDTSDNMSGSDSDSSKNSDDESGNESNSESEATTDSSKSEGEKEGKSKRRIKRKEKDKTANGKEGKEGDHPKMRLNTLNGIFNTNKDGDQNLVSNPDDVDEVDIVDDIDDVETIELESGEVDPNTLKNLTTPGLPALDIEEQINIAQQRKAKAMRKDKNDKNFKNEKARRRAAFNADESDLTEEIENLIDTIDDLIENENSVDLDESDTESDTEDESNESGDSTDDDKSTAEDKVLNTRYGPTQPNKIDSSEDTDTNNNQTTNNGNFLVPSPPKSPRPTRSLGCRRPSRGQPSPRASPRLLIKEIGTGEKAKIDFDTDAVLQTFYPQEATSAWTVGTS